MLLNDLSSISFYFAFPRTYLEFYHPHRQFCLLNTNWDIPSPASLPSLPRNFPPHELFFCAWTSNSLILSFSFYLPVLFSFSSYSRFKSYHHCQSLANPLRSPLQNAYPANLQPEEANHTHLLRGHSLVSRYQNLQMLKALIKGVVSAYNLHPFFITSRLCVTSIMYMLCE